MAFLAIPLVLVVIVALIVRLKNSGKLRDVSMKNVVSMQPIASHMYVASDLFNYNSGWHSHDLNTINYQI
jgi:L-cystine uptake protein TcyP (sodium:dicarboxylate symporter family)